MRAKKQIKKPLKELNVNTEYSDGMMSFKQIGRALGITEITARHNYNTAMYKIKKTLHERGISFDDLNIN